MSTKLIASTIVSTKNRALDIMDIVRKPMDFSQPVDGVRQPGPNRPLLNEAPPPCDGANDAGLRFTCLET